MRLFLLTCLLLIANFPLRAQTYYLKSLQDARSEVAPHDTLSTYLRQIYSVSPTEEAWPILLVIKEGLQTESTADKLIEGHILLKLHYFLLKGNDTLSLTGFESGLRYRRSENHATAARDALLQAVSRSREYFDQWLEENKQQHPALSHSFSLRFQEVVSDTENDTVYYRRQRALRWNDFQGQAKGSRYGASIFANFGYEGYDTLVHGEFQVVVRLKVYMLKSQSWVRNGNRDDYSLNHEQRHFQLAWLAAQKFKELVRQETLSPESYSGRLGYYYLLAYREMNSLQDAYDRETSHGTNRQEQARWNQWIDQQIMTIQQNTQQADF